MSSNESKTMKKDRLHVLEKIERAEVSPFLFTRIQERVQEQIREHFTVKQTVIYLAGIAAIIVLNLLVLRATNDPVAPDDGLSGMNVSPSNQLYR